MSSVSCWVSLGIRDRDRAQVINEEFRSSVKSRSSYLRSGGKSDHGRPAVSSSEKTIVAASGFDRFKIRESFSRREYFPQPIPPMPSNIDSEIEPECSR